MRSLRGKFDSKAKQDNLRNMLDSSDRKCVEAEAAMKQKEEELNATICKLEANISSLKASLADEESQKLVRVLFKRWCVGVISCCHCFFHNN
ncbi:Kinesin, motor domain-containing protein [Artemisia annua]|uniref:Kinesin, motor domain-containing protein n=1 Tax=Artemisia annua TaxID=35608 RepID=A0A2U1Q8C3_ARTAN|nr:Kinesin, motor domain-containing protein [Artemisia annua]